VGRVPVAVVEQAAPVFAEQGGEMTRYIDGMKVVIIEDCRRELGSPATGQTATYVGKFDHETGQADEWGNPVFSLQDGTRIWGCECWWTPVENAGPLPEMQEDLEEHKAFLRAMFSDILEDQ
jgi:hypothetical protein